MLMPCCRYLEVSSLNLDVESRSHLDALSLWRPHVNGWILSSQQRLTSQLATLKQQNAAAVSEVPGLPGPSATYAPHVCFGSI
jgi:hypothetical protein